MSHYLSCYLWTNVCFDFSDHFILFSIYVFCFIRQSNKFSFKIVLARGLPFCSFDVGCNSLTYKQSSATFVILVAFFFLARGLDIAFVLPLVVMTPIITPGILRWYYSMSLGVISPCYLIESFCTYVLIFNFYLFIHFFSFFFFWVIFFLGKLVLIAKGVFHPFFVRFSFFYQILSWFKSVIYIFSVIINYYYQLHFVQLTPWKRQNELCNYSVKGHPSTIKFPKDLSNHVLHSLLGTMLTVSVEKFLLYLQSLS